MPGSTAPPGDPSARRSGGGGGRFQRRQRPGPRLRKSVVGALVLVGVALMTAAYRPETSPVLEGPQMVALQALAPIERGLSRAWSPIDGAWNWTATLFSATSENPRLERRIHHLEEELAEARIAEAENARLRSLLDMEERSAYPDGYDRIIGHVIARTPNSIDRAIVIDVGSDDGVSKDDAVMAPGGLIGIVTAVSANSAQVALIINSSQAVTATVVGADVTGVLRSTSNEGSPTMRLDYVTRRPEVREGDLVRTSGWRAGELRSLYPAGIPIGVVSGVGNSPADLYKSIQVTPSANFDSINEVVVLAATDPEPAPMTDFSRSGQ